MLNLMKYDIPSLVTMTNILLKLTSCLEESDPLYNPVLVVGKLKNLLKIEYDVIKCKFADKVSEETYKWASKCLNPNPIDSCPLWLNQATIAALPNKYSRHNSPSRAHHLTKLVKACMGGGDDYLVLITERSDVFASVCAIARAFPQYTRKSSTSQSRRLVRIECILVGQGSDVPLSDEDVVFLNDMIDSIRLAGRITDTPCSEMSTDDFVQEIKTVAEKLNIEPFILRGEELKERGFGGIYHVGKAACVPPAFVCLSHCPEGATRTIAWVGKGIVYDTGGLSIKSKTTMPGMKRDCGGAAAVLGAFYATVKQGFHENLHALFCLAENAVSEKALRPDDIITLYSGKTVEVNNTDAEGRLVLGDGVAYAKNDLQADIIVDLATLTGAQGLATGRYHGALLSNSEVWEGACVVAGRRSADLVHPLIYCPELHFNEFASSLADMKNSASDRTNAEVSCAGLFIASHIGFDWAGVWLHIDMAYPVYTGERSTGYGVALLPVLFGICSAHPLLRAMAPETLNALQNGDEGSAHEQPDTASLAKKMRIQ